VLERYLTILGTIASISVLLGLLGTVMGMIRTFNAIAALVTAILRPWPAAFRKLW
jgi:biopolymer transport protein ExbB/TolQ